MKRKRAPRLDWYTINAIFDMITFEPKSRAGLIREVEKSELVITRNQILNLFNKWMLQGEIRALHSLNDGRKIYYYNPSNKRRSVAITGVEL